MNRATEIIRDADALLIMTGAGMGVDSGLRTWRGPTAGNWKSMYGFEYTELSSGDIFLDPNRLSIAQRFWDDCRRGYNNAIPHEGYNILMKWTRSRDAFVYSTNVDNHWAKAGWLEAHPNSLFEVHGNISRVQCIQRDNRMCRKKIFDVNEHDTCPSCAGPFRPNIYMFDDVWINKSHIRGEEEKYNRWVKMYMRRKKHNLAIIEIGAGLTLPTIRMESLRVARGSGSPVIRINTEDDPDEISNVLHLKGGALDVLQSIDKNL